MYFNDVHILMYVAISVLGFFIGKFIDWCNYKFLHHKRCKESDFECSSNTHKKGDFFAKRKCSGK